MPREDYYQTESAEQIVAEVMDQDVTTVAITADEQMQGGHGLAINQQMESIAPQAHAEARQRAMEARLERHAHRLKGPSQQRQFVKAGRQQQRERDAAMRLQHTQNVKQAERLERIGVPGPKNGGVGLDERYNLEVHDPKHRMGDALLTFLGHYKSQPTAIPFFAWLNSLSYFQVVQIMKQRQGDAYARRNALPFMKGVLYLDAAARGEYEVTVKMERIFWQNQTLDTVKMGLETVFSGKGWGMWVMSPDNRLFTNSHKRGELHHSGFLNGAHVKGAGEWKVEFGKLKAISGKSGHYKCGLEALLDSMRAMRDKGISLRDAEVVVWSPVDPSKNQGRKDEVQLVPAIPFMSDPRLQQQYKVIGVASPPGKVVAEPAASHIGSIGGHRTPKT